MIRREMRVWQLALLAIGKRRPARSRISEEIRLCGPASIAADISMGARESLAPSLVFPPQRQFCEPVFSAQRAFGAGMAFAYLALVLTIRENEMERAVLKFNSFVKRTKTGSDCGKRRVQVLVRLRLSKRRRESGPAAAGPSNRSGDEQGASIGASVA